MTKKEGYKEKIENYLRESSQSVNILKKKFKNKKNSAWSEHSFNEALMELLEENKVAITGYDFANHITKDGRKQSLKPDWVELEWIISERTHIVIMLNLMENSDLEQAKKDKDKIKDIFKKKFNQYLKQDIDFYDKICEKVISLPLSEGIEKAENYLNKIVNHQQSHQDPFIQNCSVFLGHFKKEYSPHNSNHALKVLIESLKNEIKVHKEQFNKCPNSILWQLKGLTIDEYNKIYEINGQDTRREKRIIIGPGAGNFPLYDSDNFYDPEHPELYLKDLNVEEPIEKSNDEIIRIFNRLLFFVNTHENYKFMKQSFALAMSDEQDSSEFFELFVNYDTPSIKKLKKELGIKNDNNPLNPKYIGEEPDNLT